MNDEETETQDEGLDEEHATSVPAYSHRHVLISWSAPEHPYYEKNSNWYTAVLIIAAAIAIASLFFRNFLFAVLSLVAGFAFALFGARRPRTVEVAITGQGIRVENKLFPYKRLGTFCILEHHEEGAALSVTVRRSLVPRLHIPLDEAPAEEIVEALVQFIPYEAHEESLVDILMRRIGF